MKLFKRASALAFLALFALYCSAQSIVEIKKNSSNNVFGEGHGVTMNEAEEEALRIAAEAKATEVSATQADETQTEA